MAATVMLCSMGSRNPARDRLFGADSDLLIHYREEYALQVTCQETSCMHSRVINASQMIRRLGQGTILGALRKHLRCSKCGSRGAYLTAIFIERRAR